MIGIGISMDTIHPDHIGIGMKWADHIDWYGCIGQTLDSVQTLFS